jgi:hypothetical protein
MNGRDGRQGRHSNRRDLHDVSTSQQREFAEVVDEVRPRESGRLTGAAEEALARVTVEMAPHVRSFGVKEHAHPPVEHCHRDVGELIRRLAVLA